MAANDTITDPPKQIAFKFKDDGHVNVMTYTRFGQQTFCFVTFFIAITVIDAFLRFVSFMKHAHTASDFTFR